jgi:hypothetical protein
MKTGRVTPVNTDSGFQFFETIRGKAALEPGMLSITFRPGDGKSRLTGALEKRGVVSVFDPFFE